jgi:hypothetical protein
MADQSIEKTPMAGTSVNKPESGTYGEKADLANLQQSLPPMGPGGGAEGGPAPMPQPSPAMPGRPGGRPMNAPAGVPDVLLGTEDAATPAAAPNAPGASPEAARLALLEQLASSTEVSETTRAWARLVLESLSGPR